MVYQLSRLVPRRSCSRRGAGLAAPEAQRGGAGGPGRQPLKASLLIGLVGASLVLPSHGTLRARQPSGFETWFLDKAMRLDYFHTGGPNTDVVALDRIVSDGPWPGSRVHLVDSSNLGKYLFEVRDRTSKALLYSRGFASLYGEWETTPEVRQVHRTFHESLRFPWPKAPVIVNLQKRDRENRFREFWSTEVDPVSRFVNTADLPAAGPVQVLFENGPRAEKVDLLVLGEGYPEAGLAKFHADARRLVEALFRVEPFRSRRRDFNVRLLDLASPAAGVHRARAGEHRRTPISTEYNIFDSERYVLTHDNRRLRDVAGSAPYDFLEILVNDAQYGGGGIHQFQATASVDSGFAEYVFIHEFGHHFAGLADEYYTSDVAYETGAAEHVEPWEPNVTALHDPVRLKWADLVTAGTPLPTPWEKTAFEKRSQEVQVRRRQLRETGAPERLMDELFREELAWSTAFLGGMPYSGRVGAFEGASYEARGLYRPEADCIMFTRNPAGFCRVCRRAIDRVIDQYAGS
jgi:hypothetical protein